MISVVIPTLNEAEYIKSCLDSILDQDYPDRFEVIVSDSHSEDKTARIAERLADKVIQRPRSIAAGLNGGVKAAKGDIIAVTHADCIVPRNWLSELEKTINGFDVAVGMVWFNATSIRTLTGYTALSVIPKIIDSFTNRGIFDTRNCAYRKDVFKRFGTFPEEGYYTDILFHQRLVKEARVNYNRGLFVSTSDRRARKEGFCKSIMTHLSCIEKISRGLKPGYTLVR